MSRFDKFLPDLPLPDIDGFDLMDGLASVKASMANVLISGHDRAVLSVAETQGKGIGLDLKGALSKPVLRPTRRAALGLAP
jgi:FixJ family two-component response regulator